MTRRNDSTDGRVRRPRGRPRLADSVDVPGFIVEGWSEPETVRPCQFPRSSPVASAMLPERRLMAAVLADAFVILQYGVNAEKGERRRAFVETEAWVLRTDHAWPYSFVNVCHALDLDPAALRAQWRRLKAALRRHGTPERGLRRQSFASVQGYRDTTTRLRAAPPAEEGRQRAANHVRDANDDVARGDTQPIPQAGAL